MTREPWFSSDRERRLWISTLFILLAIYATLGFVPTLASLLNEGIIGALFISCFVLVGVAILTQGLKVRPRGIEVGVILGIAVVYFLIGVRATIPERSHLMEYSIVAVLIFEALCERAGQGRRVSRPALWSWGTTSGLGVLDEFLQAILPSRVFEWRDILFNVLAATVTVISMMVLRRAQK